MGYPFIFDHTRANVVTHLASAKWLWICIRNRGGTCTQRTRRQQIL